MLKSLFRALILASTLSLAFGCIGTPGSTGSLSGVQVPGLVTVKGRVALRDSGYRLTRVFAPFGPYTKANITEIKVYLKRDSEGEADLGPLPDADSAIELRNLKHASTYSVRLEAWATVDGNPVRIDTQDDACITTLVTTNDDHLVDQRFGLKLTARTYPGTATGSLDLTPGDVLPTGDGVNVLEVNPPFVPAEPDPCDPPVLGCPGYVPPCSPLTPGCPGYVAPCSPLTPGCPGYVAPCSPLTPGCPGYVAPCSPLTPGCPGYVRPDCDIFEDPNCPGYLGAGG